MVVYGPFAETKEQPGGTHQLLCLAYEFTNLVFSVILISINGEDVYFRGYSFMKGASLIYATVRRAKFRPGSLDEVIQRVNSTFVPSLSTMSGFIDFYLVRLDNDAASTLSIFETQSEAEEANTSFADWAKRELASLLQGPPEIAVGEVAIHTVK